MKFKLLKKRKAKAENELAIAGGEAQQTLEDNPGEQITEAQKAAAKRYQRRKAIRKWVKRIIGIILLLALAVGIFAFIRFKTGRKEEMPVQQTTSEVIRSGFDSRITGSGTVQPIESYTLSSFIEGEILSSPYNEGEIVEEGAVLYTFDDTEAKANIQSAQSALRAAQRSVESADKQIEQAAKGIETARKGIERAQKNVDNASKSIDDTRERINKLTITAPVSGMIEDLNAELGSQVSGVLCRIIDYDSLSATVSFNSVQIQSISVGDRVSIGISSLMTSVGGTVERKYTAPHVGADGTIMYSVKVKVDSGVRLAAGTTVSVTVHTASGNVESPSYGAISYAEPKEVIIPEGGEIISISAENGDHISAGSVMVQLRSESLEKELENAKDAYESSLEALDEAKEGLKQAQDSYQDTVASKDTVLDGVKDAQTALDNAIKAAEDYTIKSPVSGVILEKHYKAGDTYGTDSNKTLMVVADMNTMVFTINVDELDISNVKDGLSVNVTADALPGEVFTGTITSVSKIGQSEGGVTGYPVEISIDEPGNLMSGMNVTAEIVVGSVEDVLVVPASAVFLIDGMYYATIVTPSETEGEPETEEQVPISVGLHNDSYYEVTDGLKEGDIVRDSGIGSDSMMGGGMYYYYG